jgi:TolB protein
VVPATGSIRLTVTTTGVDHDPDGYEVIVGDVRRPISTGTTITLDGLFAPEVHTVQLGGLARNCTVNGPNPRPVGVWGGETTNTTFNIVCTVFTTDVTIAATTTGADPDQDGYLVRVGDDMTTWRVPANGSAVVPSVPVGAHPLVVSDVDPNCAIGPPEPRSVVVAPYQDKVSARIDVTCTGAGRLEVRTATTGSDTDGSGYFAAASWGTATLETFPVVANGSAVLTQRAPVDHVVWLRGVAGNCVAEPSWQRVKMTSGETTVVTFEVECSTPTPIAFVVTDDAGNSDIHVVSSAGDGMVRLVDHGPKDADPAWSPDGSRISFTSDAGGGPSIHVMSASGTGVTRLTDPGFASYRPAWSPDGTRIVYVSERDGNAELYVMNADGTNPTRLTNHSARDTDPDWSPDGSTIAFSSDRDGNAEVYTLHLETRAVRRVTRTQTWAGHPAWSPDGTRIAFARAECAFYWSYGCYNEVVVSDAAGSVQHEVARGEDPAWSPDGSRLAVTRLECVYYSPCFAAGIEVVTPLPVTGYLGYPEIWGPPLTRGMHTNPAWRP